MAFALSFPSHSLLCRMSWVYWDCLQNWQTSCPRGRTATGRWLKRQAEPAWRKSRWESKWDYDSCSSPPIFTLLLTLYTHTSPFSLSLFLFHSLCCEGHSLGASVGCANPNKRRQKWRKVSSNIMHHFTLPCLVFAWKGIRLTFQFCSVLPNIFLVATQQVTALRASVWTATWSGHRPTWQWTCSSCVKATSKAWRGSSREKNRANDRDRHIQTLEFLS